MSPANSSFDQYDTDPTGPVIHDKRRIDPDTGQVREAREQETAPKSSGGDAAPAPAGDAPTSGLEAQLAERTSDLQRVTAEYANYRRRVDRDRGLVVDQAAERFAAQLFPIVDDIERARDHGDLTGAFKVVADRVLGLLDGLGVEAFGVAGDPFDPSLHEAVLHDTSDQVSVPTATTVLRQGFRRGDRVLRTAMVAVSEPAGGAVATGEPVTGAAAQDATDSGAPGETPAAG